jgi:site-specific DNA-methyltransferase (adenine-specific)
MVERRNYNPPGRWPANVILDESQAAELDRQSGVSRDGVAVNRNRTEDNDRATYSAYAFGNARGGDVTYGGEGGASRFFYVAKAPTAERPREGDTAHPTVKPLDLMRYLVRLVTPPGGVVLEPFAGSGTTAEACVVEGFRCIAIEREADYLPLIVQRLTKPIQPDLFGGVA